MALTIPTIEPTEFTAGESVRWTKRLSDYPPPVWLLNYAFVNQGSGKFVLTTDNGDGSHLATITPLASQAFVPGTYSWQAVVSDDVDVVVIGRGEVVVKPNLALQPSGFDDRTHVKRVLDAIEAVLEGRATEDHQYIQIEGKQITHIPFKDLLMLRSRYRAEYERERRAAGLTSQDSRIRVRFDGR